MSNERPIEELEMELERIEKEVNGRVGSRRRDRKVECLERVKGIEFELCVNRVYIFTIGRRTVVGMVEEINDRFLTVKVRTERGVVVLDLKKVSMVETPT